MVKKKSKNGTRASVSRERKLALALRAVLDSHVGVTITPEDVRKAVVAAEEEAISTLDSLGYGSLEGIPRRVEKLNVFLANALAAGDGKEISRLGLELERAKAGKSPLKSTAPVVAKKSPPKKAAAASAASIEDDLESVTVASAAGGSSD